MLRFLSIRRLAIIDAVEVEFGPGFNVLTGETGAGKSILVEAVGLLLGGRASGDLVRTGEDSATIEAIFENGSEELLIKREITAQGRSRAYINGGLATAGALKDLSSRLIELHGQHEHQTLLDPATHLPLLDDFGALHREAATTAGAFDTLSATAAELARVRQALAERGARQELAAFQLAEIERVDPKAGEDEELAAQRAVLASADRVERLCAESYAALYERDDAVLASLGAVWRRVGELAALDPAFTPYLEAREGIKSQLEDLATFIRRYADHVDASPARLQDVEDRLALLERVKRKYGPHLTDVIGRRDRLRQELGDLDGGEDRLAALTRQHADARAAYESAASAWTEARRRTAGPFARQLKTVLNELAMEGTQFEVRFDGLLPEAEWSVRGVDRAEFYVSPNPGEDLRPLARIVSGGELSRIMLAMKTLTAGSRRGFSTADDRPPSLEAPGLIFDEVDAGIGGRVADILGRKLRTLGSAFQVLCITHLPQIAAYADTHFLIEKKVEKGRTSTRVNRLSGGERVEELARMLGGDGVTDGIRASAREMLAARVDRTPRVAASVNGPAAVGASAADQRPPARMKAKGEAKSKGESERSKAKP